MHPRDKLNLVEASRKATITGGTTLMNKSINEICNDQFNSTMQYMFIYKNRLFKPSFTLPVGHTTYPAETLIEKHHSNMDVYLSRKEFIDHNLPMLDTYFRRVIQRCSTIEEYLHAIPVSLAHAILRELSFKEGHNLTADMFTTATRTFPECYNEDIDNLIYDCLSLKLLWG